MKHSTNPKLGEFTPTSLETFLECKRKYYLSRILALQPLRKASSLNFGGAVHEGIGAWYSTQGQAPEERLKAMLVAFGKAWDPQYESDKHSTIIGIQLLKQYAAIYRYDTAKYKPDMIELDVRCVMPNNTTLVGRIDRVIQDATQIVVVDTKTTTMSLTDWFWKNYENNFQLLSYDHIVTTLLGNCDTVQIDAVNFPTKLDQTEKQFQRRSMPTTEQQKEDWLNTYLEITTFIMSSLTTSEDTQFRSFHACHTSCSNYGGCPYLPVCRYGLTHPDVKLMFQRNLDD